MRGLAPLCLGTGADTLRLRATLPAAAATQPHQGWAGAGGRAAEEQVSAAAKREGGVRASLHPVLLSSNKRKA